MWVKAKNNGEKIENLQNYCTEIRLEENKYSETLSFVAVELESRCVSHISTWRYGRFLNEKDQQRLKPQDIYKKENYAQLLSEVKDKFYQHLVESESIGWHATPHGETERQKWLTENIEPIVQTNVAIRVGEFVFCDSALTVDNTYSGCVTVGVEDYVASEYLRAN